MITRELTDKVTACISEHKYKFTVIKLSVNGCTIDIKRMPTAGCSHKFIQYLKSKGVSSSDDISVEVLFATQSTWYADDVAKILKEEEAVKKESINWLLVEVCKGKDHLLVMSIKKDVWEAARKKKKGMHLAFDQESSNYLHTLTGLKYNILGEGTHNYTSKLRMDSLLKKQYLLPRSLYPRMDTSNWKREYLGYACEKGDTIRVASKCKCGEVLYTDMQISSQSPPKARFMDRSCRKCTTKILKDIWSEKEPGITLQRKKHYRTIPKPQWSINYSSHTNIHQHMRIMGE